LYLKIEIETINEYQDYQYINIVMTESDYLLSVTPYTPAEDNLKSDEIIKTLKISRGGINNCLIKVSINVNNISYKRLFEYNSDMIERSLKEIIDGKNKNFFFTRMNKWYNCHYWKYISMIINIEMNGSIKCLKLDLMNNDQMTCVIL